MSLPVPWSADPAPASQRARLLANSSACAAPQDAAPGAARGQQQKKEQQQAGAAGAAAAGEGSSPKGWVAAAAGAVALAGLSAGIYFAPENLFKPKESATGVQQPAPATVSAHLSQPGCPCETGATGLTSSSGRRRQA